MQRDKPGRKPSGMKRVNVILDAATITKATLIGHGNLSAGIRDALRRVKAPVAPTQTVL